MMASAEPAWMDGVRERDTLFGLPATSYEQTLTWASYSLVCRAEAVSSLVFHDIYVVPAFLLDRAAEFAERDGWRIVNGTWLCPACVAKKTSTHLSST